MKRIGPNLITDGMNTWLCNPTSQPEGAMWVSSHTPYPRADGSMPSAPPYDWNNLAVRLDDGTVVAQILSGPMAGLPLNN